MTDAFPKTRAFVWKKDKLLLLDQRELPQKVRWVSCRRWQEVAAAIRTMVVRGAPAIGCVAAYGVVLAARQKDLTKAYAGLLAARPTAVNLRWAIERMRQVADVSHDLAHEAQAIENEDRAANRQMGTFGASLLSPESVMITHCNTGSLATAGLGTAFGVLWTAHKHGKIKKVIATETRPYLQGARLTAWELKQEKIPFELITDNMAAHVMKTEKVDGVIVGADRIAANGDTANKIGTYNLAVLARHHTIPFYVAAPTSSVDMRAATGQSIPIEERAEKEVTDIQGRRVAPPGTKARHPAFDVTPADFITAIITEKGIVKPPYNDESPPQDGRGAPGEWRSLRQICNNVPFAVI